MKKKANYFLIMTVIACGFLFARQVLAAGHGCLKYEPDTDHDGVPDDKDDYPDDPTRVAGDLESYLDYLDTMGLFRNPSDPYITKEVPGSWEDLPEQVRNYRPGNPYAEIAGHLGLHPIGARQQRLPTNNDNLYGEYHLAEQYKGGPVEAHYDAYPVMRGPLETLLHISEEVLAPRQTRKSK